MKDITVTDMPKNLQKLDENHNIYQISEGFSFGTDAVLLSGFIRTKKNAVGVEFGTGTGIIPILLSIHKEFSHIYSFEIQEEYVILARENIKLNGFQDKVSVICGDFSKSVEIPETKVDFVFSNPPYMKYDSGYHNLSDKKLIARHEVYGDIFSYVRSASRILQDKGEFYVIYRTDRMCDLIFALKQNLLEPKNMIFVAGVENSAPKLVLIRAVKGANSGVKTEKVFYLENSEHKRTAECELLYEKGEIEWEKG